MSNLLEPIKLGELELKNRIIMAPLTRCRADEARVPTDIMREYYQQRATAGLIISEATSVCPMGVGYPNTPGIWNAAQIAAWNKIVNSVHEQGGKIMLQLWHVGRISDPCYLNAALPIAPTAVKPAGHPSLLRPIRDFVTPREMTSDDIQETITAFKEAAANAKQAGFDGVEIHGANGYLLDQFLQDKTNQRTDQYGGSLEKRARFMLEVTDAVCSVWGSGRVGMHLAPRCDSNDMGDSNPLKTFEYICSELGKRKLAFVFARAVQGNDGLAAKLKSAYKGNYIVNQQLTQAQAEQLIAQGTADAAAWGQLFIANPDLVARFAHHQELAQPVSDYYYQGGRRGYTDYEWGC